MSADGNLECAVLSLFEGDSRFHALYLARKPWDGVSLAVVRAALCEHILRYCNHRTATAEIHLQRIERKAFELNIAQALRLEEHTVYLGYLRAALHEPCGQYMRAGSRVREFEASRIR